MGECSCGRTHDPLHPDLAPACATCLSKHAMLATQASIALQAGDRGLFVCCMHELHESRKVIEIMMQAAITKGGLDVAEMHRLIDEAMPRFIEIKENFVAAIPDEVKASINEGLNDH